MFSPIKAKCSTPMASTQSTELFSKHSKCNSFEYNKTQISFFSPNRIQIKPNLIKQSRNYPYKSARAESLTQFTHKISDIRKSKYIFSLKNDTYDKRITTNQNKIDN